ncbi:MAG: acetylglutamate kinase [Chloroflexota bacterium]
MHVLKISGNDLHDEAYLASFAHTVAKQGHPTIIVHGGGKAISDLQSQLHLETKKVDGLRVTNASSLKATEMALSGHVNKLITKAFLKAGIQSIGLSGVDGAILKCHKKKHPAADLGFVGEIYRVNTHLLHQLMSSGLTVILSPISLGDDGHSYNVNADEAATAVANALNASLLSFVSNVPGVLENGRLHTTLTLNQSEQLIQNGIITDGMIPKIRAVQKAMQAGIAQTQIINLEGLQNGMGTRFLSA